MNSLHVWDEMAVWGSVPSRPLYGPKGLNGLMRTSLLGFDCSLNLLPIPCPDPIISVSSKELYPSMHDGWPAWLPGGPAAPNRVVEGGPF